MDEPCLSHSIGDFVFPGKTPKNFAAVRKYTKSSCRHEKRLRFEILKGVKSKKLGQLDLAIQLYYRSSAAWHVCTLTENGRKNLHTRLSSKHCKRLAKELNPKFFPVREAIKVRFLPKRNGGFRPIYQFRLKHRICQTMIKNILVPQIRYRDWHYDLRGPQSAIAHALKALNKGYTHVTRLDVVNYFTSFDKAEVSEMLPVPSVLAVQSGLCPLKDVQFIFPNNDTYCHMDLDVSALKRNARRGLPQGAVSSPAIAAYFMSQLDYSPPRKTQIVVYVDDIFVLSKDESNLAEAVKNLKAAIDCLPGGQFDLLEKSTYIGHEQSSFLGIGFVEVDGVFQVIIPQSAQNRLAEALQINFEKTQSFVGRPKSACRKKHYIEGVLINSWRRYLGWAEYYRDAVNFSDISAFFLVTLSDDFRIFGYSLDDVNDISNRNFGAGNHIRWSHRS